MPRSPNRLWPRDLNQMASGKPGAVQISELHYRLYDDEGKAEAVEVLRTLIDEVMLIPEGSELTIALRGDLAAMLTFASNKKKPELLSEAGLMGDSLSPVSLVAGIGFEPMTFRL